MDDHPHTAVPRNLYGRARHRRLSDSRRSALEDVGPLVNISGVSMAENPERKQLAPDALSGGREERWLEIGFGTGEHLLALARARPEIAMIGAEPYLAGVSRLLATARHCLPDNLRVHAGDGRDLLDVIPGSIPEQGFPSVSGSLAQASPRPAAFHLPRKPGCARSNHAPGRRVARGDGHSACCPALPARSAPPCRLCVDRRTTCRLAPAVAGLGRHPL